MTLTVTRARSRDICEQLRSRGYGIFRLTTLEAYRLSILKLEAMKFFLSEDSVKRKEYYPGEHIGYRPVGGEYVGSPEFWDTNESLNFSEMSSYRSIKNCPASEFYRAAARILPIYDQIMQGVLRSLQDYYKSSERVPRTRGASWVQVNFYRRSTADREARDLMQGKHEDGHLLTLWSGSDPGLEFFPDGPDGRAYPLTLANDEMLAMPGDLLTILTGGDIQPLYHQVRRCETVATRLAAMYFPNPEPRFPFYPFSPKADRVDLTRIAHDEKLVLRPGQPPKITIGELP